MATTLNTISLAYLTRLFACERGGRARRKLTPGWQVSRRVGRAGPPALHQVTKLRVCLCVCLHSSKCDVVRVRRALGVYTNTLCTFSFEFSCSSKIGLTRQYVYFAANTQFTKFSAPCNGVHAHTHTHVVRSKEESRKH